MPKLPKGMFKRPGRGYYCRIRENYADRWVSLGTDFTQAQTQFKKIKRGELPPTKTSVRDAAKNWLKTYVRTQRSKENQIKSEGRVRLYMREFLGFKLVGKVTGQDLRNYRLWLQERMSVQSVAHVLSDARCFFNWCEDSGLIDRSPFPKRLMPRIQERPPDRLTEAKAEILEGLQEPYGFVLRLALGTGLRWGELIRLQPSDFQDGQLVVHQTKSAKLRRVPVPDELQTELRLRLGKLVPFVSSGSFARMIRKLSGVEGFHVHQTRHTFACRWLERGGSLAALQAILGHSSIVTTQRYAKLTEDHVRAEMKRLDSVANSVAMESEPFRKLQ